MVPSGSEQEAHAPYSNASRSSFSFFSAASRFWASHSACTHRWMDGCYQNRCGCGTKEGERGRAGQSAPPQPQVPQLTTNADALAFNLGRLGAAPAPALPVLDSTAEPLADNTLDLWHGNQGEGRRGGGEPTGVTEGWMECREQRRLLTPTPRPASAGHQPTRVRGTALPTSLKLSLQAATGTGGGTRPALHCV
jgi:hypothetical protein